MKYQEKSTSIKLNGEELVFKTGVLAPRADAAVTAQMGETTVLAIVTVGQKESDLDYFPLTVEYVEKFYAGGIISGSKYIKRENRPSESAVLKARQIDHSIRSLFPKGFKREVAVIVTVLTYDEIHDPEILAVNASSLALMLSSIPFAGPSSSIRVGVKDNELQINPSDQLHEDDLDGEFMISVTEGRILNIEGWGSEIPEEKMAEMMDTALEVCGPVLKLQKDFAKDNGKTKFEYKELPTSEEVISFIKKDYSKDIETALRHPDNREMMLDEIRTKIAELQPEWEATSIRDGVDYVARKIMRAMVLDKEERTSGRKLDEIRELEIEIGVLPRVHGSALFRRGLTQCMSIITLGSTRLMQTLESYEGEEQKRFMHHYNGPSYSLGEPGRFSYYPGRREIGHGNIGENALRKMLPPLSEFPYAIRAVSEILSQKGSSSMAASCGTSLALMEAGVPIKAPVGGISVGLVTDDENVMNYKLLTDIEDVEDFYGDMDFKVTGTTKGVTAIQMDNKLMGVPVEILKNAFAQSREARMRVLDAMNVVINEPKKELNKNAPRAKVLTINPAKIGELIGPGGKNIRGIIEKAGKGADVDIKEDGTVNITAVDQAQIDTIISMIEGSVSEPELGKVYKGKVDKVTTYGAFVDVSQAISGLVHVSEMTEGFVADPSLVLKEGDEVNVKIVKLENGRVSFSMKGLNDQIDFTKALGKPSDRPQRPPEDNRMQRRR